MRVDNLLLLILAAHCLYIAMAVLRAVVLHQEGMPDEAAAFWRKTRTASLMAAATFALWLLWRWW